jgi:dienelactone hydrolase
MKPIRIFVRLAVGIFAGTVLGQGTNSAAAASTPQQQFAVRVVALNTPDGIPLKASYFAAAKPGPGVLLFHQSNRTRQSWDDVARQLASAGINTLTIDVRGYGESGGKKEARELYQDRDLDAAFEYLVSQPAVERDVIGAGGAGWLGVDSSVEMARRHAEVRSLVLMSGETLLPQLRFLRQASQLPGLFIVSDDDEYPPTVEAMEWLYDCSSSPQRQFIHYIGPKAPWLWYETSDASKVPATGSHGTDLLQRHPELPATIVDWFVTTLIRTPGRAPTDAVASAVILNQIEMPGGVPQATQQLKDARDKDPKVELWPEVNLDIIGEDHMRLADAEKKAGHLPEAEMEMKVGIEIFKLNLLAYPDSADAHANLADAYLTDGQRDLAREYAEKALAMIDSHNAPVSSWSDTEQRRTEVRNDVLDVLKKLGATQAATRPERAPNFVP